MADHILKTTPDGDCYVIWSVNDESPDFIGTRAELEAELKERGEYNPGRMARVDEYGSSARYGSPTRAYGWDDTAFVVGAGLPENAGRRMLPRVNLEAFARAALEERADDMLALTEPCNEEDE